MSKKWKAVATSDLNFGAQKETREEKFKREEKFRNGIKNTVKMTDKNVVEVLDEADKWMQEQKAADRRLIEAYKAKKLRSKRLIQKAKKLSGGSRKTATV